ncbi:MAG: GbsR/MarR family transcriptional regulator [Pseudomonadota bacterium]
MNLSPLMTTLVLHFGEMGSRWGINRTVGQIYAYLVFSQDARNADQIGEDLGFSRSNVSMGLKELKSWNLLRPHHQPGDRKEYFSVPEDVWEIARILVRERRQRELDPTLSVLRDAQLSHRQDGGERYAQRRVDEMLGFLELIVTWTEDMQNLSADDLRRLMKLGAGVNKVLEFSRRGRRADSGPSALEPRTEQDS